jgi:hypothetical protein
MTTLRFSAVDSEPARTARMANATTRTIKEQVERILSSTKIIEIFLLTYAKESEGIMHMSWMHK